MRILFQLTVLLLACAPADAQQSEVEETAVYEYDLTSLKAGSWVEFADPSAKDTVTSRLACTKVDDNVAWIEKTSGKAAEVLLLGVSKASNLVLFAYAGKPGEFGRKIQVAERHVVGSSTAVGQPAKGPKIPPDEARKLGASEQRKCTVASEPEVVSVGEQKLSCEKWTVEYKDSDKVKLVETFWINDRIPFRRRMDKSGNPMISSKEVTWEGKPTVNGGIAMRTTDIGDQKSTRIVKGFGDDAKPTLLLEGSDAQEKK